MLHVALKHEHRTATDGDEEMRFGLQGGWANVGFFISPKHSGEAVHGYELHKEQISQAGRGFSGLGVVALGALPQRVEEEELWERLVDCLKRQLRATVSKLESHTEIDSLCWRFVVWKKGRKAVHTIIAVAKCHKHNFLFGFSSASSKGSRKLLMQLQRDQGQLFKILCC